MRVMAVARLMATFLLLGRGDRHNLTKVCQRDTIRKQRPYILSKRDDRVGSGAIMNMLRLFAVVYLAQAGVGIAVGVGYAVWLVYW